MKLRVCVVIAAAALPFKANAQITNVRGLPNIDYAIATANNVRVVKRQTLEQYQENTLEDLASCALRNSRGEVDRALALKVDTQDYVKSILALASSKCLRAGSYYVEPSALRVALFRELYRSDFRHHAPATLRNATSYLSDINDPTSAVGRGYVASRELADCVVVADPADSRKLVLLELGDRHEERVFATLINSLHNCLPAGASVSLNQYQVSGWIAEALYRESKLEVSQGSNTASGKP